MKSKFFLIFIILLVVIGGAIYFFSNNSNSSDSGNNKGTVNINNNSSNNNQLNINNNSSNNNQLNINDNNNNQTNTDNNSNANNGNNNETLDIETANAQGIVLKKYDNRIVLNPIRTNNVDEGQEDVVDLTVKEGDANNVIIYYDENTTVYYCTINRSNYSSNYSSADISNVKIDSTIYAWGEYENTHSFKATRIAIIRFS